MRSKFELVPMSFEPEEQAVLLARLAPYDLVIEQPSRIDLWLEWIDLAIYFLLETDRGQVILWRTMAFFGVASGYIAIFANWSK